MVRMHACYTGCMWFQNMWLMQLLTQGTIAFNSNGSRVDNNDILVHQYRTEGVTHFCTRH